MARSKRLINFKSKSIRRAPIGNKAHDFESPSEWRAESQQPDIQDAPDIPLQRTPSVGIPRRTTGYGYNPATQTLVIEYLRGGTYAYDGITQAQWDSLQSSPSPGRWINSNLKFSGVDYTRL
jgi:hypothetical protein